MSNKEKMRLAIGRLLDLASCEVLVEGERNIVNISVLVQIIASCPHGGMISYKTESQSGLVKVE